DVRLRSRRGLCRRRRLLRRDLVGRGRRRRPRPPRALIFVEEIPELILSELRRAQDQVDAGELPDFGALARIEEQEGAVRRPGHAGRVAIGQEADRLRVAARGWYDADVGEPARTGVEEGDPSAVGRPGERMPDLEFVRDDALRERPLFFRLYIEHAQLG